MVNDGGKDDYKDARGLYADPIGYYNKLSRGNRADKIYNPEGKEDKIEKDMKKR
jgi:hypothetical protein